MVPSIGDVVFLIIFSVALVLGAGLTQRDGDLAMHLELGRTILDEAHLPTLDDYSHTRAGRDVLPYEWLAQTVLAGTERMFGFDGLGVLAALMAALPWAILYRWLVRRDTPVLLSAGLALLGAAASMIHWAARPHMFTWLFVTIWVIVLEDHRREERHQVWLLVPLTVLWVNTHGGFVVGYILIGTYLLGALIDAFRNSREDRTADYRQIKHLLWVLLASFAASFINPSGYRIVLHPFIYLLGDDFLFDFTREYNSPNFHNPFFLPFLAMIVLSVLTSFRWTPTKLLLTAFWTVAGLYAFRNIPLYAIAVTPILAVALTPLMSFEPTSRLGVKWCEISRIERNIVGGSLAIALVAFSAFSLARTPGSAYEFGGSVFPEEAVAVLSQNPPGDRVFNQFVWGGYLIYCCHPEIPVFIDGRTDYYGPDLTRQYDHAIRGLPGWDDVFEEHDIDWALISPETGLAQILAESNEWEEIYRDSTAVAFARTS